MKKTWQDAKEQEEKNARILRGENPRGAEDPEWLAAHLKVQSMMGKWQKTEENHGNQLEIPEPVQHKPSPWRRIRMMTT